MGSSPSQPASCVVVCKTEVSVDGRVNTLPPKEDVQAEEARHDAPLQQEPMAETDSGTGQNLPSATLQSGCDVEHQIQGGCAEPRSFLSPSFKGLKFLSPIPEVSPLARKMVHRKPSEERCAGVTDGIQQQSFGTLLGVEGRRFLFGNFVNAVDVSLIGAESSAILIDYTMESSCHELEENATNKLEFRSPHLDCRVKVHGRVVDSAKKWGGEREEDARGASPCFSSQKSLVPLMEKMVFSPHNVSGSGSSEFNGTYNLSPCQGSKSGQGLQDVPAGNVTFEAEGPITKEGSFTRASSNTFVLHSGSTLTGCNMTVDVTEETTAGSTAAAGVAGSESANSKGAPERLSGEVAVRHNLTVDIMQRSGAEASSGDSIKSLGLKNGTFVVYPDPVCAPGAGLDLTVGLTTPNVAGPKTGSTEERACSQNVTTELQPGPVNEPMGGLNLTFNTSQQLGLEGGSIGVCGAQSGPDGHLWSLTKAGNCDSYFSQTMDKVEGVEGSLLSLDGTDRIGTSFITSTPMVVPKVFRFDTKPVPSDACERLSVLDQSETCCDANPICQVSDGCDHKGASAQVDRLPPAEALPLTKPLSRPSGLPLKCGAKAQPSCKKSLKSPVSKSSSSRFSLAPPQKTLAGPQLPGTGSLLSSTLTRIGRKAGGALRNVVASSSLEASVGSTTSHGHRSASENKPPVSGLQKPRPPCPLQAAGISLLALRPTGQTASRHPTQRAAAGSRLLGLGDPKGKNMLLPASSLKQPRAHAEDTLPLSKRKKADTLNVTARSAIPGCPAGSQRGLRRPATHLGGPQSKLQSLGGGRISAALSMKKPDPLPPDVPPAQGACPSAVSDSSKDDPRLTNGAAGKQDADCENCSKFQEEIARLRSDCAKFQQENARLREELQKRDQENS